MAEQKIDAYHIQEMQLVALESIPTRQAVRRNIEEIMEHADLDESWRPVLQLALDEMVQSHFLHTPGDQFLKSEKDPGMCRVFSMDENNRYFWRPARQSDIDARAQHQRLQGARQKEYKQAREEQRAQYMRSRIQIVE